MSSSSFSQKFAHFLASRGKNPGYIIGLDSATAALEGTAAYLKGEELKSGDIKLDLLAKLTDLANFLPDTVIENLATLSGWLDASRPSVVDRVQSETMSTWVMNKYPEKRYPGVVIGAANGALTHFCAALGIPYLPQTLLVCIKHRVDRDDAQAELEWSKPLARRLLAHNPDLRAYQMHDANQDRLKVGHVTYFRLKRTRLGTTYERFLKERLQPGGTIYILDCRFSWLFHQISDRHIFQFGGTGYLTPEDYLEDSQQIRDFLKRRGSKHQHWKVPPPDGRFPESEWGFDNELGEDIEAFARQHDLNVRRITFDHPQEFSAQVADLYRWWYQQRGLPTNRLLVESFTFLQPLSTLKLGLVPYWSVFNDKTSLNHLNRYLDDSDPYDEIYMNLFSNGLYSLGIATIDEWRAVLGRALQHGQFIGVNERKYPRDISSFVRHATEMKKIKGNVPLPQPLGLYQLDAFLNERGDRYQVKWS